MLGALEADRLLVLAWGSGFEPGNLPPTAACAGLTRLKGDSARRVAFDAGITLRDDTQLTGNRPREQAFAKRCWQAVFLLASHPRFEHVAALRMDVVANEEQRAPDVALFIQSGAGKLREERIRELFATRVGNCVAKRRRKQPLPDVRHASGEVRCCGVAGCVEVR